MPRYLISFDQRWVGDHTGEWFTSRGPLARAVMAEMEQAGVLLLAGGLEEEDGPAWAADPTSGTVVVTEGRYDESASFVGGMAVVDVADDEAAQAWGAKVAEACGWPQEVRRFKP